MLICISRRQNGMNVVFPKLLYKLLVCKKSVRPLFVSSSLELLFSFFQAMEISGKYADMYSAGRVVYGK